MIISKQCNQDRKGFTLIETLISLTIFLIFSVGVYSGLQFVFKVVYQSRIRILEGALLNEQIEILHNMPYEKIGIINGSPSGVLARTVTTTKSGMNFTITRTIRNVDDGYDGTIGGTPNDISAADYKLADVSIICDNCGQRNSFSMSTLVAPKYLEGDPNHGALFIQVFDANAAAVIGANVHVVATSTNPTIDLNDTTDNGGFLRLVDLGAGVGAYSISVSKSGYTNDATLSTSVSIPNPVKPPVSVVKQNVSSISFSIDRVSTINLRTKNPACTSVASVPVNLKGTKIIGSSPDTLLVNQNITTSATGTYTFSNMVWDTYNFTQSGYDLIGSIPQTPSSILPGSTQPVDLILGTATANSLLINVRDSITGQPVSSATITVTSSGFSDSRLTDVGFIRQTNWSGGTGQASMVNSTKYWSDNNGIERNNPTGDIKLKKVGSNYVSSGILESSTFDFGESVNLVNINWEPLGQPSAVGASSTLFRLAASNSSTPASWNFLGPDGTTSTYYSPTSNAVWSGLDGNRYLRYKVYLSTPVTTSTPTISDITVTYINSCIPPGQAYFGGLSSGTYTVQISATGYQTKSISVSVSGDTIANIDMLSQ